MSAQTVGQMTTQELTALVEDAVENKMKHYATLDTVRDEIQRTIADAREKDRNTQHQYVDKKVKASEDRTFAALGRLEGKLNEATTVLALLPDIQQSLASLTGSHQTTAIALQAALDRSTEALGKTRDISDEVQAIRTAQDSQGDMIDDVVNRSALMWQAVMGGENNPGVLGTVQDMRNEVRGLDTKLDQLITHTSAIEMNVSTDKAAMDKRITEIEGRVSWLYSPLLWAWGLLHNEKFWYVVLTLLTGAGVIGAIEFLDLLG